jgi:hypothetical protein
MFFFMFFFYLHLVSDGNSSVPQHKHRYFPSLLHFNNSLENGYFIFHYEIFKENY